MPFVPHNRINRATLPPEMIIDDFIEGDKPVSYENYLTEFINKSSLFLSLSKGQEYHHTPKNQQSNGECDCRSNQYELDFKLLGTQSGIYAKRNLSFQKARLAEGVLVTLVPRQIEGMEITLTNTLLKQYSLDDLLDIDHNDVPKFDRNKLCPEADAKGLLKAAKCKKNTLFFYIDFIYSDPEYTCNDITKTAEPYFNECFSILFQFRNRFVPDKDTFFAVIVQGYLCIAIWKNNLIQFKDYIPLSSSTVFSALYRDISMDYTTKLLIK